MLPTYRATLREGSLDRGDEGPPPLPPGAVPVQVTILVPPARATGGPTMSAALEAFAAAGGPTAFGDPIEWQRDVRAERPLPGREG